MLTLFGFLAVTVMMVSYMLELRSAWWILLFAAGSAATSVYSGLAHAYPITFIEAVWSFVALQRFLRRRRDEALALR